MKIGRKPASYLKCAEVFPVADGGFQELLGTERSVEGPGSRSRAEFKKFLLPEIKDSKNQRRERIWQKRKKN